MFFRELFESEAWRKAEGKMALPLAVGKLTEAVFGLASRQDWQQQGVEYYGAT